MDYVLWIYFAVILAGAWAYMFALGGPEARAVLTLGIYGATPRPAPAGRPVRRPNARHKRRHRSYPAAPPAPAVGVAHVPAPAVHVMTADPATTAGDVLLVQHAAPLPYAAPLADPAPVYARSWDNFPDRLLADLNARSSALQLDGWGTGEWRAAA